MQLAGGEEFFNPGLHSLCVRGIAGDEIADANGSVDNEILPARARRHRKSTAPRACRIIVVDDIDRAGRRPARRDGKDSCSQRRRDGHRSSLGIGCCIAVTTNAVANVKTAVVVNVFCGGRIRGDKISKRVADVGFAVPPVGMYSVQRFVRLSIERGRAQETLVMERIAAVCRYAVLQRNIRHPSSAHG